MEIGPVNSNAARVRWYLCPLEPAIDGVGVMPARFSWLSGPGTRRTSFNLDTNWCLLRVWGLLPDQARLTAPLLADIIDSRGGVRVAAGPSPLVRLRLNARFNTLPPAAQAVARQFVTISNFASLDTLVEGLGRANDPAFDRRKIFREIDLGSPEE